MIPATDKGKLVYIDFDGVYQKSTVWINGHELGFRPNGYISFRYELTPYLNYGGKNVIAVKVDNSVQPNSRWYSGSGIYRNVWLVKTEKTAIDHWGTYITTPEVSDKSAKVEIEARVKNISAATSLAVKTIIYDEAGELVAVGGDIIPKRELNDTAITAKIHLTVKDPALWSVDKPYLYKAVTSVVVNDKVTDTYTTLFGIRYFDFDPDKGFSLNGKHLKIYGVGMRSPRPWRARLGHQHPRAGKTITDTERDGLQRHPHLAQPACARTARPVRQNGFHCNG
jgi:beta-galactosidase